MASEEIPRKNVPKESNSTNRPGSSLDIPTDNPKGSGAQKELLASLKSISDLPNNSKLEVEASKADKSLSQTKESKSKIEAGSSTKLQGFKSMVFGEVPPRLQFSKSQERTNGLQVVRLKLENQNHQKLSGTKFIQISDLHLGPATKPSLLKNCFETCNKLEPEFICLTGDLIQLSYIGLRHFVSSRFGPTYLDWASFRRKVRELTVELYELFSVIKCPVYVVPGNHDHYEGLGTLKRLSPDNFEWLINSSALAKPGLRLVGIDDLKTGKQPNEDFLSKFKGRETKGSSGEELKILLSHNPDFVRVYEQDFIDSFNLALSGHTHGGQIRLPFLPPLLTRTKQRKHVSGLSYHRGTAIYVNKGIGFGSVPLRTFCPSEITVFEL